jgi:hypothetical protein
MKTHQYLIVKCIQLFFLSTLFSPSIAQEIIKVNGIKGVGVIAGRLSFDDARHEALNKAKVEALRQAGVSEHLTVYEQLYRSEINNDFSEFFNSDVQAELQGAVKEYTIINQETTTDPQTKLPNVEVTIDATVIKYSARPDPTFSVRVEGIKQVYEVGEYLTFTVFATQSCYLNIFAIADDYTCLLYPNFKESFTQIPGQQKVNFPFRPELNDYELYKESKQPEVNRIVFVFTKTPVQYLNHSGGQEQFTSSEAIFSWIYGLMPDQRKVDYQVFTLR